MFAECRRLEGNAEVVGYCSGGAVRRLRPACLVVAENVADAGAAQEVFKLAGIETAVSRSAPHWNPPTPRWIQVARRRGRTVVLRSLVLVAEDVVASCTSLKRPSALLSPDCDPDDARAPVTIGALDLLSLASRLFREFRNNHEHESTSAT